MYFVAGGGGEGTNLGSSWFLGMSEEKSYRLVGQECAEKLQLRSSWIGE